MADTLRAAVSGLRHGKDHCDAYRGNPDCAIGGRARLIVDAWEGANSTAVCLAAIESAKTGRAVTPRFYPRPPSQPEPVDPLDVIRRSS